MGAKPGQCMREGCINRAMCTVGFTMAARGFDQPGSWIISQTGMQVCAQCAGKLTVNDVITDENWNLLVGEIVSRGKMPPHRPLTKLCFTPIT